MSVPSQVFQNQNIRVDLLKNQGCNVKLNVTVLPETAHTAYVEALKTVSKNIPVPPSHKNKTPEKYILEHHKSDIQNEWKKIVIQTALQEAVNLTKAYPFDNQNVKCDELSEISQKNGWELAIEYVSHPLIPIINLTELTLGNVKRRAVTKKDIDLALDNIRLNYATWTDVTDRSIKEGDYVDLDICKADDPTIEICRNMRFFVKKGRMNSWIHKLVLGKNIDDIVEGISELDQNQQLPETATFEPTLYVITIKAIKTASLPEVNDEMAKKSGAANLSDLIEQLTGNLNLRADGEVIENLRHQVDRFLLKSYHFDLPSTLLQNERIVRINSATAQLEKQKLSKAAIKERISVFEKTLDADIERNYRLIFLLQTFAKLHNIQVSNEEVAKELTQQVMQNTTEAFNFINNEDVKTKLALQILLRKARDYIIQHVCRE